MRINNWGKTLLSRICHHFLNNKIKDGEEVVMQKRKGERGG